MVTSWKDKTQFGGIFCGLKIPVQWIETVCLTSKYRSIRARVSRTRRTLRSLSRDRKGYCSTRSDAYSLVYGKDGLLFGRKTNTWRGALGDIRGDCSPTEQDVGSVSMVSSEITKRNRGCCLSCHKL